MISNPDKVIYPKEKYTKKDLIEYYNKIAPLMLPHLKDRFLTLERYPDGINTERIFQKNRSSYFPAWVKSRKIKGTDYVICNDKKTLLYLANQAVIGFHISSVTNKNPSKPNKMIFDLDPPENRPELIEKAAKALKMILEYLGFKAFFMTTGSRGLHIIVPLDSKSTNDEIVEFSRSVAEIIVRLNPEDFSLDMRKDKRENKLFIDIFRNSRAQTSIAPYSTRPKDGAPIASPIPFKEITSSFNPQKYNIKNIFKRYSDPWKDYNKYHFSIKKASKKLQKANGFN